ncbi:xanthine dehydrogenase YagR molybdenum-binding subunit [Methylobacterium sp. ap11]|uniref:xanthine dehydrogenase family protein molybdopterin-binding subunit n=1 Tax=Methylobacterium sp. ap11 TaxID=1761799 RepID=UPI0008D8243F|nr:xanthine dehydrogenase family protein molybdopterin-binding subunit [Methylobacterium sp. ap11]SEO93706.1 xanthine dehydrogenase YagR molybdenum-binding subunit [Methylobacterium sp. ap11]
MTREAHPFTGRPIPRTEAGLKVSGAITYAGDVVLPGLLHAVLVPSPIARGTIRSADTTAAAAVPGVVRVFTPGTMPRLVSPPEQPDWDIMYGSAFVPMADATIHYAGQPIGLVLAETLEAARHAAAIVRYAFDEDGPCVGLEGDADLSGEAWHEPEQVWLGFLAGHLPGAVRRGDAAAALSHAEVTIEGRWTLAYNHHNPMEPAASVAVWEDGDRLTLYETSQHVANHRNGLAKVLGLPRENVRVVAAYVGGGFGCKGPVWSHSWLAALAAREVGRPVRLVLSRAEMYTSVGFREEQRIDLALGATRDGRLVGAAVTKLSATPAWEDWVEPSWYPFTFLYDLPALETRCRLRRANVMAPTFMRAPGEAPGMLVQECALNELAAELGIDPIDLRLRNHADAYPVDGSPWSSKRLKECYRVGAERFGWPQRRPEPRTMREDGLLIGIGMASASHTVYRQPARARVTITAGGTAHVAASATDIGTGTATFMRQLAADALALPIDAVRALIGDTGLPEAPMQAGASLTGSLAPAVMEAARDLTARLLGMAAGQEDGPFRGRGTDDLRLEDNRIVARDGASETVAAVLRRAGLTELSCEGRFDPGGPGQVRTGEPERDARAGPRGMHSFGAIFARVAVDPDLGMIRVRQLTGVYACGRILNPKLSESQLIGGITWGMSQALFEATHMDPRFGRFTNTNLAEYMIPVNLDVPVIDVTFLDDPDPFINPAGVKGVGEIGITGVAAAISDAVWHATGKRLRSTPILAEALLED